MFVLEGNVSIGNYSFNSFNEVEITKSIEDMSDTAVVKMPTRFKVRNNNDLLFTEQAIKVGDKVVITLGYKNKYSGVEFVGYVKKFAPKIPLEIHCEDAMWLLRRNHIKKLLKATTLKAILKEVVSGTTVEIANNIPDVAIDQWAMIDKNGAQVLEDLKKQFPFSAYINDEGKLYCGLEQLNNIGQSVVYDLNYNLVENNLEFRSKNDRKIRIKYTYIGKDNKKKSYEFGDSDGELRTFHTSVVSDEAKLKEMANVELEKLKYDGFDGDVVSFLIPFANRGMKAIIRDKKHSNREGSYLIKKVVTTFGMSGARRKVTISNKL
ncbi:late control protein [Flavobacterium sp. N1994]|uniref:late control protein n=1 Tax=Flavobacterium sp. N1994 TaxID=2986827 RepID=UPI002221983D|nr:late control protein [Flavobacterium sp. N1994]